jgi:nucleotide-binding universal stress UspA family protein
MNSSIRSLTVHMDATPRCEVRLRIALSLARTWRAQLTALYAVTPAPFTVPPILAEGSSLYAPQALDKIDRDRRTLARALFDRVMSEAGSGAGDVRWLDAGDNPDTAALARRALVTDLLVLGQHDPTLTPGMIEADLVAVTLIDGGAPALVVPYAGSFMADTLAGAGLRVLLAWKPTREAARAVRAALPWLQRAGVVHIAADSKAAPGPAQLREWLALHEVRAEVSEHGLGNGEPGEMLLSLAADVSADLMVMGCFGHSRARELLLGGVSRTVLRSMTLPTLMAH